MAPKKESEKFVFLNEDKRKRAEVIFKLLNRAPKTADEETQKSRFLELLAADEVNVKNESEAVAAIYKLMGGAIRTYEQVQKIKTAAKSRLAKNTEEEEPAPATKDDEEEEDEDEDEDEK